MRISPQRPPRCTADIGCVFRIGWLCRFDGRSAWIRHARRGTRLRPKPVRQRHGHAHVLRCDHRIRVRGVDMNAIAPHLNNFDDIDQPRQLAVEAGVRGGDARIDEYRCRRNRARQRSSTEEAQYALRFEHAFEFGGRRSYWRVTRRCHRSARTTFDAAVGRGRTHRHARGRTVHAKAGRGAASTSR